MQFHVVKSADEVNAIVNAAHADSHYVFPPTHWWTHDGQILGAFSNGVIPVGHFWMKRDATPRQSLEAIKQCREIAREAGIRIGLIACKEDSPFHPVIRNHFKWPAIVTGTTLFNVQGL